jgi:hypothetical protein
MDDLLLDSSYLFPIFGVELEYRDFESAFSEMLDRYSVKYSPASLIEAKWYVLRQSKKNMKDKEALFQSYRRGLSSLEKDHRLESTQLTNERIEELSDILLTRFQVEDYFDRLIYSTAANLGSILLTEDSLLHEIFKKASNDLEKPKEMMRWKYLLAALNRKKRE